MPKLSVLFVDDEPLTRKISSRLLGRQFTMVEAEDGDAALNYLDQHAADIGVIVTDMKMRNIDGLSLIRQVSIKYPAIPIVASTGDLDNYDFRYLKQQGKIFDTLEKPWEIDHAAKIITAAMQYYIDANPSQNVSDLES